jgi:peptidoglycan/xylan/chitin deacetylase (PgdA/CDA1 family)
MTERARECAISIDLDGVGCYYRIHGLGPPPEELEHVVMARALPRAAALFAEHGVHVTWFVIGRDADADAMVPDRAARIANAQRLALLARQGDELGNHSYSHPYELAKLSAVEADAEIAGGDRVVRALLAAAGVTGGARGFRAPGYDVSPAMMDALARLGYRYDSSIFPAPGYYVAKAVVMTALQLQGRPSGAVMTDPRALAAPVEPYRPAMTAPWRRGQAPLVELPVAVTKWMRLPAIGTTLVAGPPWLRRRVLAGMARRPFFNLELHGIDFADAEQDGIPGELVERQPDLRVPISEKLQRLASVIAEVKRSWDVVTLADVATRVQRDQ